MQCSAEPTQTWAPRSSEISPQDWGQDVGEHAVAIRSLKIQVHIVARAIGKPFTAPRTTRARVSARSGRRRSAPTSCCSRGEPARHPPLLGWLEVAVTGSDTSSNVLFGALQIEAARGARLNPLLMAAANSSDGVLGRVILPA